jgi:uncharacterized Zn finger protein (UPF0148 family)
MRVVRNKHKLLAGWGTACPLCGSEIFRGSYFCAHCRRSGRVHLDPAEVRELRREVFIPRELAR